MSGMEFAFGTTVTRQRRNVADDPYSGNSVPGDWDDPDEATIVNAFVSSASSAGLPDAIRSQKTSTKSLYAPPEADVQVGDRILSASHTYEVTAVPQADTNPFSGWQPVAEIPLTEVLG